MPSGIEAAADSPNGSWTSLIGSATQSVETKQPLTKFTGDGTPYLDFDGVDDFLSIGPQPQQVTYTIVVRSKTPNWSIWSSFVENVGAVDNMNKWGSLLPDSNTFQSGNLPEAVRVNGVPVSSPFPVPVPSGWNVITVRTALSPAAVERAIFNWENRFFLNAQIIALFIHDGTPTTEQVETVESYHTTLKPDPLADVPSLLDLRTHTGDKVPLGIAPGVDSPNGAWIGRTGAGAQSVETKQPLTKFATDGTPFLVFDGVDDWMSVGPQPVQVTYSILARSPYEDHFAPAYSAFIDSPVQEVAEINTRWALFENPGSKLHFNPPATSLRIDGVPKAGPLEEFDQPLDVFRTYTIKTALSAEVRERGIAQYFQQYFARLDVIALFIHAGDPTTGQVATVEAYYDTLKPAP